MHRTNRLAILFLSAACLAMAMASEVRAQATLYEGARLITGDGHGRASWRRIPHVTT